jgi:hypothetical protein
MMNYVLAMMAGFAVLVLWPLSRDKLVRNTAKTLATLVFTIGLLGAVSRLLLA